MKGFHRPGIQYRILHEDLPVFWQELTTNISQDSSTNKVTGYGHCSLASVPGRGSGRDFSLCQYSIPFCQMSTVACIHGCRSLKHGTSHLPPSSIKIKSVELYLFSPIHLHGVVLWHRDKFHFTFSDNYHSTCIGTDQLAGNYSL